VKKGEKGINPMANSDPFLRPAFPLRNRLLRALWGVVYHLFFRFSPRLMHGWRRFLLRAFGATIGRDCHIYPKAQIWAPWNLVCGALSSVADGAIVYNPQTITLGSHSVVSQYAYLCGATHDYDHPDFPLISSTIVIGDYAWVCARASVLPGVAVGEGAVLGLGAVAAKDLEPWGVYAGSPARRVKDRKQKR
jgi:putative colanic acid biosynthesis acetyltransferase WcaF